MGGDSLLAHVESQNEMEDYINASATVDESQNNHGETAAEPDEEIKILDEVTGSHHGQLDAVATAYMGETPVGSLQYSLYENTPYISMIEVLPEYRRRGIAARLLRNLQSQYSETEIAWGIRHLVDDYAESKCRLAMLYDTNPDNLEEHRKKAVAEADKLIANKILGVIKAMLNKDYELRGYEYTEAQKAYRTEQMVCEILMLLEQSVMALDEEYKNSQAALNTDLSKAAKKEWYLRHKDKGMEI